jgi:hypothetical protein
MGDLMWAAIYLAHRLSLMLEGLRVPKGAVVKRVMFKVRFVLVRSRCRDPRCVHQ